jgi:hypothetical protein
MSTDAVALAANRPKRNILMRLLFGALWFLPVRFTIHFLIGGVVGFMAGFKAGSPEAGQVAGRAASLAFFASHDLVVSVIELVVTFVLGCIGILPGTGKFKSMI